MKKVKKVEIVSYGVAQDFCFGPKKIYKISGCNEPDIYEVGSIHNAECDDINLTCVII